MTDTAYQRSRYLHKDEGFNAGEVDKLIRDVLYEPLTGFEIDIPIVDSQVADLCSAIGKTKTATVKPPFREDFAGGTDDPVFAKLYGRYTMKY